jgi:hypothetical protein
MASAERAWTDAAEAAEKAKNKRAKIPSNSHLYFHLLDEISSEKVVSSGRLCFIPFTSILPHQEGGERFTTVREGKKRASMSRLILREQIRERDGDQVPDNIGDENCRHKDYIKGKLTLQEKRQGDNEEPDRLINQLEQEERDELQREKHVLRITALLSGSSPRIGADERLGQL